MDSRILSLRGRGRDLMDSGDYDRAIAAFNEAIQLDREYPALYSDRGQAYFKKGNYQQAISDFQMAFNGMPSNDFYRRQLNDAMSTSRNEEARKAKKVAEEEALKAKETAERLHISAEQGDIDAQYELGLMYKEGKGVPKDSAKAKELINKAAEQGNPKAREYQKNKKKWMYGVILHLCFVAAYLFILWGTGIIRSPWVAAGFKFVQVIPLVGFSLALGIISAIFLRSSDYFSGFFILIGIILVQSITSSVWKGNIGFLGLHFLFNLIIACIINIISVIPSCFLIWKEIPTKEQSTKEEKST